MASIQKRTQNGQSRWIVRHRIPDGTQRSRSFTRLKEAQQYRTTVEADTMTGQAADPRLGRSRFADVAATWQAGRVSLRATTRAAEQSRLGSLVLPTFADYPVAAITAADVQAWIAGLHDQGYSAATVAKAYRIVRAVLNIAVRDRLIPRSPIDGGIELPVSATTPMTVLTTGEIAALAEAVGPYWRTLILTAAGTGMRWGELAGLKTDRLDLLRRRINVVEQLTEVAGHHTFTEPNTASAIRTVTLPTYLVDEIARHMAQYPNDSGVVFSTVGARSCDARTSVGECSSPRRPLSDDQSCGSMTCATVTPRSSWHPVKRSQRTRHAWDIGTRL